VKLLVTGGAGYIGSHTTVQLLQGGHDVHVIDDLSNSERGTIDSISNLAGREFEFSCGSVLDKGFLSRVFKNNDFDAVIHFAALKDVNDSLNQPLKYYQTNVTGTLNLCEVMEDAGVYNLLFSSSAAVYGNAEHTPITEKSPTVEPLTPYGKTKLMAEKVLTDIGRSSTQWKIIILRYFNPVGAHESGLIGESLKQSPTNLMPVILNVAAGNNAKLSVFGNDYPTEDGTCIRDFIHVQDLASGHIKATEYMHTTEFSEPAKIFNLGTGNGYSVMQLVKAFELESKQPVPIDIVDRREGDIAISWADPSAAKKELGWKATRNLNDMCRDSWNFYCEQYLNG
jgi:UDP-glucose 4-epimerase|tara:strand:- start:479 stop:1498 length:1020 start_codon:yes stop_codon:yes gene_type:complete